LNKIILYQDVFRILLGLIAFSLPFSIFANSFCIALLIVFFIAYIPKLKGRNFYSSIALLPIFFLMHLIGLLYTSNIREGMFQLEVKQTLFIFPVIFLFSSNIIKLNIEFIIRCFVKAVYVASFICIVFAFFMFFKTNDIVVFQREELTSALRFHPIYFSLFIGATIVIENDRLRRWRQLNLKSLILNIVSILFLLSFNILLSAKMPLFALVLGMIVYIILIIRSLIYKSIIIIFILISSVCSIIFIPFISKQFNTIANSRLYFSVEENNANSLTLRLVKWQCSLEGIRENFFVGLGTGDAQDYLQVCYVRKNFWGSVFKYNSHNEYLSIGLRLGLIGFSVFVFSIIGILSESKSNPVFFSIILLIAICFLTESMLSTQKGVVFFSLITSLSYWAAKNVFVEDNTSNNKMV